VTIFTMLLLAAASAVPAGVAPSDDLATLRQISARTPEALQIRLAETAAPPQISSKATIYVLRAHGYEMARKGTNAFTCFVDRTRLDSLEPECMDAEGFATTFQTRLFAEQQRAAGVGEKQINAALKAGYESGRFKAPRRPGLIYMLSQYNYLFDDKSQQMIHAAPHLMFYGPGLEAKDVGDGPGAPILTDPGKPDNLMIVMPRAAHKH
jgi:hypothetical protein